MKIKITGWITGPGVAQKVELDVELGEDDVLPADCPDLESVSAWPRPDAVRGGQRSGKTITLASRILGISSDELLEILQCTSD